MGIITYQLEETDPSYFLSPSIPTGLRKQKALQRVWKGTSSVLCLMLLIVLLLPSGFLAEILTRVKKNCYQHCYTESFSLEWVSAKQVASLIYIVVTKSALLLVDFLGSGCCDHENQIEQGTGYTFCGIISAPLLLRAEQKPVGCSWTWMAPRGFCYSSAA